MIDNCSSVCMICVIESIGFNRLIYMEIQSLKFFFCKLKKKWISSTQKSIRVPCMILSRAHSRREAVVVVGWRMPLTHFYAQRYLITQSLRFGLLALALSLTEEEHQVRQMRKYHANEIVYASLLREDEVEQIRHFTVVIRVVLILLPLEWPLSSVILTTISDPTKSSTTTNDRARRHFRYI